MKKQVCFSHTLQTWSKASPIGMDVHAIEKVKNFDAGEYKAEEEEFEEWRKVGAVKRARSLVRFFHASDQSQAKFREFEQKSLGG